MTDDKDLPKIKSLSEERHKKAARRFREAKLTKQDVFVLYTMLLEHSDLQLSPLAETFKVIEMKEGHRLTVKVSEKKECFHIDDQVIISALVNYWNTHLKDVGNLWVDHKNFKEIIKYWRSHATPIALPAAFAGADEDIYCYRKLPFSYKKGSNFPPMFMEILSRLSNAEAFTIFMGSLFYPESYSQQYLWLYGPGGDGKGALMRLLGKIFGQALNALTTERDAHWTESLVGTRVGLFAECSNPKFVTSGFFKQLTGGDSIRINPKGKPAFSYIPVAKYIFLSNERPAISSEKSEMRRAIFCEFKSHECAHDPAYEHKLWAEAEYIFGYCRDAYEAHVEKLGHDAIPMLAESLDALIRIEEEQFEAVFEENFELTDNKFDFCTGIEFRKAMDRVFPEREKTIRDFRNYLERLHRISYRKIRLTANSNPCWRYDGLKAKKLFKY